MMTYKLDPSIVEKINSQIRVIVDDDKTIHFKDGMELAEACFDRPYAIKTIEAGDDEIILRVSEKGTAAVPFD